MSYIPSNAELMGREMLRVRLQEAEKQRLIRIAALANLPETRKTWPVLRDRWLSFWNRNQDRKIYPISSVPGKSHSI